jgi:hypothetical protein
LLIPILPSSPLWRNCFRNWLCVTPYSHLTIRASGCRQPNVVATAPWPDSTCATRHGQFPSYRSAMVLRCSRRHSCLLQNLILAFVFFLCAPCENRALPNGFYQ